jgi:hypothetical protein
VKRNDEWSDDLCLKRDLVPFLFEKPTPEGHENRGSAVSTYRTQLRGDRYHRTVLVR